MITNNQRQQFQKARLSRDPRFDGLFFVGVKTTGIFCRPICPANLPLEKNVEYFDSQQQAIQSGLRPCLRCRPDSAPGSWAWKGVNTTLERGLRLLHEHPHLSISDIATKLGISERYLHQLLVQHMALSPKQFKLYSQLMSAKQLLHQTQLSVEDIACAVGFNSSRSLQQHMKSKLDISPSQIRKRKNVPSKNSVTLTLHYRPPYNWEWVRDFLAARAINAIEHVDTCSYSRSFHCETDEELSFFKATHDPTECAFHVELSLTRISALLPVIANIRRVLDLDANPSVVNQGLSASGMPSQLIDEGIRLPGAWSPFEAACRAVLGQQVSVRSAIKQLNNIITHLSSSDSLATFPTPQQMTNIDNDVLRMPQARKSALKAIAQAFVETPSPAPEVLLGLKGIGPWTVNYIKLRGYSEPNILLSNDLIVARQIQKLKLQPAQSSPWGSYLTMQLWQCESLQQQGQ
ncbi:DNA-3-methyladenine glycosylase 2 family protein [Alteromonas facilis]|uniref:DNA-3-methyladenine glycosylase 2 family protein n=1 Tax=Alteromonas facilis TaxID=2048004 RepID=UPI000C2893B4|nr:AlkA N-terminal domain-containing protein [Alteromonas facilis]